MKICLIHLACSNRDVQRDIGQKLIHKLWKESASDSSEYTDLPKERKVDEREVPELIYGPHGKPYLKDNPWYFNISHSGEYLLFVQGKYELGADLQIMRPCRMDSIAKKAFTEEERHWIGGAFDEEEKLKRFYHIWCRKEAYGKYLGCGLTEEVFTKNTLYPLDTIVFLEYDILEGYHICICCKKEEESEKTVHLLEGL